jgi:hypothetical protein
MTTGRTCWVAENCSINPGETGVPTVERRVAADRYDCVALGAGVRLPANRRALFEALVNPIDPSLRSASGYCLQYPPGRQRRGGRAPDLRPRCGSPVGLRWERNRSSADEGIGASR